MPTYHFITKKLPVDLLRRITHKLTPEGVVTYWNFERTADADWDVTIVVVPFHEPIGFWDYLKLRWWMFWSKSYWKSERPYDSLSTTRQELDDALSVLRQKVGEMPKMPPVRAEAEGGAGAGEGPV